MPGPRFEGAEVQKKKVPPLPKQESKAWHTILEEKNEMKMEGEALLDIMDLINADLDKAGVSPADRERLDKRFDELAARVMHLQKMTAALSDKVDNLVQGKSAEA